MPKPHAKTHRYTPYPCRTLGRRWATCCLWWTKGLAWGHSKLSVTFIMQPFHIQTQGVKSLINCNECVIICWWRVKIGRDFAVFGTVWTLSVIQFGTWFQIIEFLVLIQALDVHVRLGLFFRFQEIESQTKVDFFPGGELGKSRMKP